MNNQPGKTTVYRKVQNRSKNEPFYRELKEERVRESEHTITLQKWKIIRKSDVAVKRQSAPKKFSPRKKSTREILHYERLAEDYETPEKCRI